LQIRRVPPISAAVPQPILDIRGLSKTYKGGVHALDGVDLTIERGEIFALLGPNWAGKTTLINIICGTVNPSGGQVTVGGHDIIKDYRKARDLIGLVPQELTAEMFAKVWDTTALSRGLFGKAPNRARLEQILKQLSLWDKKDSMIRQLSGGMKRRVMIAKALSHEPSILFLDEPTAGVDVALRRDMWNMVRELRNSGVTIILTTHYIEEAQDMADRIGVINKGEIIVVEEKAKLMRQMGKKQLTLSLSQVLSGIPSDMASEQLKLSPDGLQLIYSFDTRDDHSGIAELIKKLEQRGIDFKDLHTKESSLEDIFVGLVSPS